MVQSADKIPVEVPAEDIRYFDLDALRLWEDNYNQGDINGLKASFVRWGFDGTVRVWNGTVMAGNQSVTALKELKASGVKFPPTKVKLYAPDGRWFVPGVDISHLSWAEAKAFAIADNNLPRKSTIDEKQLAGLLTEISANLPDALAVTGYNEAEVDALIRETQKTDSVANKLNKNPKQALDTYLNNTIKQIVLYFKQEQYERFVDRLQVVMDREGQESHTDAVLTLLDYYELGHDADPERDTPQD